MTGNNQPSDDEERIINLIQESSIPNDQLIEVLEWSIEHNVRNPQGLRDERERLKDQFTTEFEENPMTIDELEERALEMLEETDLPERDASIALHDAVERATWGIQIKVMKIFDHAMDDE